MNPGVKAKWLEALRSGKYKQARLRMRHPNGAGTEDGFCCLGVLCEVLRPNEWTRSESGSWMHHGNMEYPSGQILREAGLEFNQAKRFAGMNDNRDTFEEIADHIEDEL